MSRPQGQRPQTGPLPPKQRWRNPRAGFTRGTQRPGLPRHLPRRTCTGTCPSRRILANRLQAGRDGIQADRQRAPTPARDHAHPDHRKSFHRSGRAPSKRRSTTVPGRSRSANAVAGDSSIVPDGTGRDGAHLAAYR
jgi:hypothetical protein